MTKKYHLLLKSALISWIPIAITIIALSGLIYVSSQQVYRQSANDPQIQIAEDLGTQLAQGVDPNYFMPQVKTDISRSLAVYVIVFDKNGKIINSSATIAGKDPEIPGGVFANTKAKTESRFTWEAKSGDRSAAVIRYYNGKSSGFILVGRSLKEVEGREEKLGKIVFVGLLVTLFASFVGLTLSKKILEKK